LERDLGTPVFHRTTHEVVLTPAGEAFLPAARAALAAAARARAAVSPLSGEVRLGVGPGLLADWHRAWAALRQAHPGLAVEVRRIHPAEAAGLVRKSVVDVTLTAAGDCAEEHELVTTLLPREELVLVTAPGDSRTALANFSNLSFVDFPPGWAIREAVDRAFPGRRRSLEVEDLAVAAGLVRTGPAACVLPLSAAGRLPGLTVRRFDQPPPWQLAARYRGDPSPAVAALVAQLD
jgi:DNA-binding transcriptional LysR family regulator